MKLNERQLRMLKAIAHAPRPSTYFTHGEGLVAAPPVVLGYLRSLEESDFIELVGRNYAITLKGRAVLDREPEVVSPRYFGNASVPSSIPYRRAWMPIRDGGNNHEEFSSLGQEG